MFPDLPVWDERERCASCGAAFLPGTLRAPTCLRKLLLQLRRLGKAEGLTRGLRRPAAVGAPSPVPDHQLPALHHGLEGLSVWGEQKMRAGSRKRFQKFHSFNAPEARLFATQFGHINSQERGDGHGAGDGHHHIPPVPGKSWRRP